MLVQHNMGAGLDGPEFDRFGLQFDALFRVRLGAFEERRRAIPVVLLAERLALGEAQIGVQRDLFRVVTE